ncbi:Tkl protein kinase, partial [Globisporangium polare]
MHSWKIMWSWTDRATHYEGEWRKTGVKIETYESGTISLSHRNADESGSRWFELSHPNVVKLLGACNVGNPLFVVYELVPGGRHLLDFLHEVNGSNRGGAMWSCLYQAALGLRYIHSRGFVHGELCPENILVGSNLVTKLSGPIQVENSATRLTHVREKWIAMYASEYVSSAASDIYAFGMCIWEALTLELPWEDRNIYQAANDITFPERPSIMTNDKWDLITKMCKRDPVERVDIDFVVNRLEKFVFDSEQRNKVDDTQRSNSTTNKIQNQSVEEYLFIEGATIPETLKNASLKCDRLPEEDQWMPK